MKSFLIATLLLAVPVAALARQSDPPPEDPLVRGRTEIGLRVGVGFGMHLWGGLPDSEFLALGVDVAQVLTGPLPAGPLSGHFVIAGEFYPAIVFHEDAGTTFATSVAMMMRYHFAPGARVRPFISAGGGMVFSAGAIPRDISRVNFTPQGGGGVTVVLRRDTLLSIEYRLHHMSDGVLTDYNPGVNSSVFLVGISWIR